ncbi:META domain-containing protein [Vibrio sp. CAIM 722]|uniref:META domain-containing protein n=1 Tax=Vibrio eleionomae TaxID=2653505 RepID=A0A7X4RWR9_9VIBR|nr:META domain-containing protein [Vibrio eleionomae]MZI95650.1 META domain-containing protein [Vibrio eleionomae]
MKLSSKSLLAATVSAIVLAGCASHKEKPVTSEDLQSHRWELVKIDDKAVKTDAQSPTPFLQIGDKMTASGNAGCNNFFGQGLVEDSKFRIEKLALTMKLCLGDVMDSETIVQQSLSEWNKLSLNKNTLTLKNSAHTLTYKMAK